jgi:hypothetical protein
MYEAVQFRGWFGLLLTVQKQPAIITLEGSYPGFQFPDCIATDFVFTDTGCYSGSLDHTVLVVGYDLTYLNPNWIIRNSWGPDWCHGGYMRIAMLGDPGICGMNILPAFYPVPMPDLGDPCYLNSTIPYTQNNADKSACFESLWVWYLHQHGAAMGANELQMQLWH